MTMIGYAFLQHRRLAATAPKKRINGPPPQPTLPAVRHAILELFARLPRSDARIVVKRPIADEGY